jgi:DNA-binding NtrC family response regulator
MLIETKNLTTKQLLNTYLAVTGDNHADVARLLDMSVHTLRDRLRGKIYGNDDIFRAQLELALMQFFEVSNELEVK